MTSDHGLLIGGAKSGENDEGTSIYLAKFGAVPPLVRACEALVDTNLVLRYNCDSTGQPLPDGTPIKVRCDTTQNGPERTDPLATVGGGLGEVTYNTAAINGDRMELGAGHFLAEESLCSDMPIPARRFFLHIQAGPEYDYVSSTFALPASPEDRPLRWSCQRSWQLPDATEPPATIAESRLLFRAYPNPFNAVTTLSFSLPQASHVTIRVFDLLGRETGTLANGDFPMGEHVVEWNPGAIASGVHFIVLETPTERRMLKVLLLR